MANQDAAYSDDSMPQSNAPFPDDWAASREHSQSIIEQSSGDTVDSLPVRTVEYPVGFTGKSRRSSVSAESDRPSQAYTKRVIPKTPEAMDRIRKAVIKSILFSGLEEAQKQDIFDSMEELKVSAGEVIITQFQEGDYFYVIDSGKFDVMKRDNAQVASAENDGYGKQVFQYEAGGSFGELALMHNCPRAATVRASTPGVLWRTDRETFHRIIIDSTAVKRRRFEEFLESVPLLSGLSRQERAQVADCLETIEFQPGELIIKQGEDGDKLFLILDGKAKATQTATGASVAVEVGRMAMGAYFGERSLITREPRAANVIAVTTMTCACMDRSGFERLLGPLKDIMKQHAAKYAKAEDVLKTQTRTSAQSSPAQPSAQASPAQPSHSTATNAEASK